MVTVVGVGQGIVLGVDRLMKYNIGDFPDNGLKIVGTTKGTDPKSDRYKVEVTPEMLDRIVELLRAKPVMPFIAPDPSITDVVRKNREERDELNAVIGDLAMLVRRLVRSIDHDPSGLTALAMDYLKRKGLQGSPLRDGE